MLRNSFKSNNSKSKRKSGFFKSDDTSLSFSQLPECDHYSNQHVNNSIRINTRNNISLNISPIQETLEPVPETNNINNNAGNFYSTGRSTSERSISSNLSFLSKNSSVLDLIYQDLEESINTEGEEAAAAEEEEEEGKITKQNEENFSPLVSKALFVIKDDARDKGQWKLLNDETDPTIDYYPQFSHDVQYPTVKRIELEFR